MNDREQLLEEKRMRSGDFQASPPAQQLEELLAVRAEAIQLLVNELTARGFSRSEAVYLAARNAL